jgi:alkanesulfonate monooxygenase SsuD/methylene tetrahydromethanopterin reductase-like flavin-dependent oxidoreductase (luciferase family)
MKGSNLSGIDWRRLAPSWPGSPKTAAEWLNHYLEDIFRQVVATFQQHNVPAPDVLELVRTSKRPATVRARYLELVKEAFEKSERDPDAHIAHDALRTIVLVDRTFGEATTQGNSLSVEMVADLILVGWQAGLDQLTLAGSRQGHWSDVEHRRTARKRRQAGARSTGEARTWWHPIAAQVLATRAGESLSMKQLDGEISKAVAEEAAKLGHSPISDRTVRAWRSRQSLADR